jgi:hypothetical protein
LGAEALRARFALGYTHLCSPHVPASLRPGFVPSGFERYDSWVIEARGQAEPRASLDLAPICALRARRNNETRCNRDCRVRDMLKKRAC